MPGLTDLANSILSYRGGGGGLGGGATGSGGGYTPDQLAALSRLASQGSTDPTAGLSRLMEQVRQPGSTTPSFSGFPPIQQPQFPMSRPPMGGGGMRPPMPIGAPNTAGPPTGGPPGLPPPPGQPAQAQAQNMMGASGLGGMAQLGQAGGTLSPAMLQQLQQMQALYQLQQQPQMQMPQGRIGGAGMQQGARPFGGMLDY